MLKSMKVALWQLKSWKGSLRVLIVMLLAVMFTIYKSSSYIDYLKSVDGIINIFETYVIVSSNGWHHALMFMLALVLFADAPFMDNNSLYVVCRIGRYKWCLGKILYIIMASIIFNAVIMLTTIAVSVASPTAVITPFSRQAVALLQRTARLKTSVLSPTISRTTILF